MAKLLIVDDEEGIRDFLGDVLEDEGHDVTLASDGQEAADLLTKHAPPDLIGRHCATLGCWPRRGRAETAPSLQAVLVGQGVH